MRYRIINSIETHNPMKKSKASCTPGFMLPLNSMILKCMTVWMMPLKQSCCPFVCVFFFIFFPRLISSYPIWFKRKRNPNDTAYDEYACDNPFSSIRDRRCIRGSVITKNTNKYSCENRKQKIYGNIPYDDSN